MTDADAVPTPMSSVTLNMAEGSKREGGDRKHHFRIAAGSLLESRTGVAIAEGNGWLDGIELTEPTLLADREAARIHRLIRPRR